MNIRRLCSVLLCGILLLTLTGCRASAKKTISGEDWDESWMRIGRVLGVEAPAHFELINDNDALSVSDIYYTEWACGKPLEFTNGDGETAFVYDAQLYLLLRETTTLELAESSAEEWKKLTEKNYDITENFTKEYSGLEFSVYKYNTVSEDNPYSGGVSAFGVWEHGAVSVELIFKESFSDDPDELLSTFLNGFHYA